MLNERPQPYVGVSGVAYMEQHGALVDIAIRERPDMLGYFIIAGVQATGKTQVRDIGNKYGPDWHPVGEAISRAAANEDSGFTRPFVHVFFDDIELTPGIANVMRRTRHYCQGIQFNGLPWVDRNYAPYFRRFGEKYPNQSVILQAGSKVLDTTTPEELTDTLVRLPVDYVLLDPSGGTGTKLQPAQIREYADAIYQRQLPVGVGVAGGLDAETVHELFAPLAAEYPDLSCDAEGRLRSGPEGATMLDLKRTEDYILAWKSIVGVLPSQARDDS